MESEEGSGGGGFICRVGYVHNNNYPKIFEICLYVLKVEAILDFRIKMICFLKKL